MSEQIIEFSQMVMKGAIQISIKMEAIIGRAVTAVIMTRKMNFFFSLFGRKGEHQVKR
ncbi:hypothetical protein QNH44_02960 [Cytobacillus firmus]|uniref:hypothetical protein n=1 Tax=Cytobacillus firmus TaxID=1399 RepID=UPI0024C18498|nr:hypothetical protein [Cytobacillus firmus]WHY34735.1 hypothetical protein QNH44_02960 [Cytobacillus firmus]